MNLNKITILFLILSVVCISTACAQNFDDWEARPNISLKYKMNKKWSVTGTYYMYLDKNMSQIDKSVFGGEINYKVNSWMKAGVDYRFGVTEKGDYHDVRYSINFKYKPTKKWTLGYRPLLQQEFGSYGKKHPTRRPVKYFVRNRLTVGYEVARNTEIYVYSENYLRANQGFNFTRQKSGIGVDYKINKRNSIGTKMDIINKRNGKNVSRLNLNYTYTLGK